MKNKIIALLILTSVFFQNAVFAADSKFEQQTIDGTMTDSELAGEQAEVTKEKFQIDVGMLSEKQIKALNQKYTKLDLRRYVNRNIKDDVDGDHKGGWSDQGENDLRQFDAFGNQEMLGVPFYFINPEENEGNAVLGLRGQNDTGLPTSVTIPVNKETAGAYFIQASPYCSGTCGVYTWVYEDGSESYMDIVQNEHICDFWGTNSNEFVRPAWTVKKADGSIRSLYLFAMNNPHPEKMVKELRLETEGGGAYIMIMAITLTDKGPYLTKTKSSESITTSTYGWYDYEVRDEKKVNGSILDFSGLLDAPAGKHGKILADGDSFVFEDGTKASFWGTEITGGASFPAKEQADEIAAKIAGMGYNLVRFSEFDEELLKDSDKTEIDSGKLDRLAYFVSKLQEKGIYSCFSFLSKRTLRENDGVENYKDFSSGYGIDAFFDDKLIELQKAFISDFLDYKNPYTGKKLGEDNSIVMAELAKEISIFDFHNGYGKNAFANKVQYEKARLKFNGFLLKKYKTTSMLDKAWESLYDKNENEKLEEKSVELKACFTNPLASDTVKRDTAEFLCSVLDAYYKEIKEAFGNSAMLVTLNSNPVNDNSFADVYQNSKTDFVMRAFYNAKPYGDENKMSLSSLFNEFGSMTRTYQNMVRNFAECAPYKKPYVANWASAQPNLYFAEASVMMAAFAGQKSWTAIEHSFANGEYSSENYIDDFYSSCNNPVRLAIAPVAACIYYTSEQEPEKIEKITNDAGRLIEKKVQISDANFFSKNTRTEFAETAESGMINKTAKSFKTSKLYQNTQIGLFEVRGDMVEALSGFLTEREEMPTFSLETDNSFVTAGLVAVDGKSIKSSGRYLLTLVGSAQNYKNYVNLVRRRFESLGEKKIIVEAITGRFVLKQKGKFKVYSLTSSGERKKEISVSYDKNGYPSFVLSASDKALQYEIVKTGV